MLAHLGIREVRCSLHVGEAHLQRLDEYLPSHSRLLRDNPNIDIHHAGRFLRLTSNMTKGRCFQRLWHTSTRALWRTAPHCHHWLDLYWSTPMHKCRLSFCSDGHDSTSLEAPECNRLFLGTLDAYFGTLGYQWHIVIRATLV